MDYYTIIAQHAHLKEKFTGHTVDMVRLFDKHTVFLGFDSDLALKLSCVPGMPYLHTVEKRYLPKKNAHPWHSSKLTGATLDSVEIVPGDRILNFRFNSGLRLIFEMTGRYANIILVDSDGVIAGSTRTVTNRHSGFREIRPGVQYSSPPARFYIDIVWGVLPVLEERLKKQDGNIEDALATSLCAGSRLLAREALTQSGISPESMPDDLSPENMLKLLKTLAGLVDRAEKGGDGGTAVIGSDGLPYDVFPMRMVSAENTGEYFENLDEAVMYYARHRETGVEIRSLRQSIMSSLVREEKSLKSTMQKVKRESGDDSETDILEHKGNSILANLHCITKGMDSVTVPDPYDPGSEITIELDPVFDGPGNAERYFTRARKLKAARKLSEERIENLTRRITEIQQERVHWETIDDLKELRAGASAHARINSRGQTQDSDQPFPRRFITKAGLEIIVGRNDKENDELIRWAHKNDIWLHAQGVGGSHVILRSPGKQNPDHRSIEIAAAIAAYFSKSKTSAVVPVAWTLLKYVVKQRGQGPGQVHYTREKVLFVEPALPGKENKE